MGDFRSENARPEQDMGQLQPFDADPDNTPARVGQLGEAALAQIDDAAETGKATAIRDRHHNRPLAVGDPRLGSEGQRVRCRRHGPHVEPAPVGHALAVMSLGIERRLAALGGPHRSCPKDSGGHQNDDRRSDSSSDEIPDHRGVARNWSIASRR